MFLFIIIVLALHGAITAQTHDIDILALTQETQLYSKSVDEMVLVWWIPEEFWVVSFSQEPTITEQFIEEFLAGIAPYTIIVIADGKIGPFGGITYRSEKDIRSNVYIVDKKEKRLPPFDESEIDPDTRNFLSMIKPVLVNMLGPMGQNMHFFAFPSRNENGERIVSAVDDGSFSLLLNEREFRWRTPLGSLLKPILCLVCNEELNGAYNYCPWDGTSLSILK